MKKINLKVERKIPLYTLRFIRFNLHAYVLMILSMLVISSIVEAQDVRRIHQFGTIGTDVAAGVVVDESGNVFVAGQAGGALPGQGAVEGFFDAVVRKYDSAGTEVWMRQFGSSGSDGAAGVALDAVGNVYVVGTTDSTFSDQVAAGGHDAFIRQYDSIGTEVWTRQFGSSSEDDFSLGDEFVYDVAVDTAGNVYVAGGTDGTFVGQTTAGGQDAFVRKYDSTGTEVWTRQFGSDGTDIAFAITADAAGNVYLAGSTTSIFPGQPSVRQGLGSE